MKTKGTEGKSSPSSPPVAPVAVLRDAGRGAWMCFRRPLRVLVARRLDEVLPALVLLERAVSEEGLHAAGFVSYEASPAFDPALTAREPDSFPLLWFGLFRGARKIALPPAPPCPAVPIWEPSLASGEYSRALERIKEFISAGETYQVNFTYRLRAPACPDPWGFFLRMLQDHDPPYGAFVDTGEWAVCSSSPELFFRLDGSRIESRPMKGTASRGLWPEDDLRRADELRASEKERAENTMIVDMVRNDLGRIADTGSVRVSDVFALERYPTVWQMTSTVQARTLAPLDLVFRALFPPASVTGAPKVRTTEIIAALENSPRGIYTGAIGFAAPGRKAQFNVAIRTLAVDRCTGLAEFGVGGGIVWDSRPEGEWEECGVKARVVGGPRPTFDLLETTRWTPEESFFLLDLHLGRLEKSAGYFGFPLDLRSLRRELERLAWRLPGIPHRVRLLVSRGGAVSMETVPFEQDEEVFPELVLACSAVDPADPFLYHKTTHRAVYQDALRARPGWTDVLLYNGKGEVTESAIANIAAEVDGVLCTPPVSCGLLPGTFRAWMLGEGRIRERTITVGEVLASPRVYRMNSLRGMERVKVLEKPFSPVLCSVGVEG